MLLQKSAYSQIISPLVLTKNNANDKMKSRNTHTHTHDYWKHQRGRCFPTCIDKMATTRKPHLTKCYQQ